MKAFKPQTSLCKRLADLEAPKNRQMGGGVMVVGPIMTLEEWEHVVPLEQAELKRAVKSDTHGRANYSREYLEATYPTLVKSPGPKADEYWAEKDPLYIC